LHKLEGVLLFGLLLLVDLPVSLVLNNLGAVLHGGEALPGDDMSLIWVADKGRASQSHRLLLLVGVFESDPLDKATALGQSGLGCVVVESEDELIRVDSTEGLISKPVSSF
jgi:hypothetical protein